MDSPSSCRHCGTSLDAGAVSCLSCGEPVVASSEPEIAGYTILSRLGEGGMGAVFLARDDVLGRKVAIKVISGKISRDPQARARFLREARTLATVEHPNVVRVYSFGEIDDQAYLVLEYVEGETLADRIARTGPLPLDDALRYLRQVVNALGAAQERGIVHRDIKPSNILIDSRDEVRVADFGLAKATSLGEIDDSSLTQTGYMLGTPHYVSPEQALGKPVDFRGDIYSLGIVLYEMLTAERPFRGTTPMAVVARNLHEPLPDIRKKRPDVPPSVADLLDRMTRKDPAARPASYEEIHSSITVPGMLTVPDQSSRVVERPPLMIAAIAAIIGLLLGIVAFFWIGPPEEEVMPDLPGRKLTVAVAPFWGPDELSAREGRVMAALVERAVEARLGGTIRVAGIDETAVPIRSHDEARELGRRMNAGIVVWGETLSLRDETEIVPSFTLVGMEQGESPDTDRPERKSLMSMLVADELRRERDAGAVRLSASAPDQIDIRRTSAEGVGEMVTFLAGLHELYVRGSPRRALSYFEQVGETADLLRNRARALARLGRNEGALEALRLAVDLDPAHVETRARVADLLWMQLEWNRAIEEYRLASESGTWSSSQAVMHRGQLFAAELFRPEGEQVTDTGYLLLIDPVKQKVIERHFMPGRIEKLESRGDGLVLTWSDGQSSREMVWQDGVFTPSFHPGGDVDRRMRGVRNGREIGVNFLGDAKGDFAGEQPRYRATTEPDRLSSARPSSLSEMETYLSAGMDRDPTQPWYWLHLGFVLQQTGREEQAESTWSQMFGREWPGVPYWEFAWMAQTLERLGEQEWADRAFERALALRQRLPQPVSFTRGTEIDFMAPFVRMRERELRDQERSYQWLSRSRELVGTGDGSRLTALLWSEWFERQDDVERATRERDYAGTLWEWNDLTLRDYVFYLLVVVLAGGWAFSLLLIWTGWRRVRRLPAGRIESRLPLMTILFIALVAAITAYTAITLRHHDPLGTSLFVIIAGSWSGALILLLIRDWRWMTIEWQSLSRALVLGTCAGFFVALIPSDGIVISINATLILFVVLFVLLRTRGGEISAATTILERRVLLAIGIAALLLQALFSLSLADWSYRKGTPGGVSDSFGHPRWHTHFDEHLAHSDHPELIYAAAVSRHLGGDLQRAATLYRRIPEDDRAIAGLAAAEEGRIEVTMPSQKQLAEALGAGAWRELFPPYEDENTRELAALLWFVAIFLPGGILLIWASTMLVPALPGAEDPLPGRRSAIAGALFPSFWWIRTGRAVRGIVTLLLLVFVLVLALTLSRTLPTSGAPGMMTHASAPDVFSWFPVPLPDGSGREDLPEIYRSTIVFSYRGSEIFYLIAALSLVALAVFHFLTIRDILRTRRSIDTSRAPTLVTPIPDDVTIPLER